jgi:hypothetical protein
VVASAKWSETRVVARSFGSMRGEVVGGGSAVMWWASGGGTRQVSKEDGEDCLLLTRYFGSEIYMKNSTSTARKLG